MSEVRGSARTAWSEAPPSPGPPAAIPVLGSVRRTRPAGQQLYDMPYSAAAPRLVNPELGLRTLVARAGHNAGYEIDVTLLDAPDHRLIRSGVLLAHRVLDGRGEWYLTAPDWQPLLPKDRIEPMGHADLPDDLADLIRPLRRRAALGPVAGLRCDRREFALRDEAGTTVALLRDDKVTVRRGGLTTARYREVMLTPVGPGLTAAQAAWVERALLSAGSALVPRFPRLVTRLGAPATGPSDIPPPVPFDPAVSFKRYLAALLGLRLRRIVEADLTVRGGDLRAAELLAEEARLLGSELRGLTLGFDVDWVGELADEVDWLTEPSPDRVAPPSTSRPPSSRPSSTGAAPTGFSSAGAPPTTADPPATDRVAVRLRGERYLGLLDRLVTAARAPSLGETVPQPAAEVVTTLLQTALERTAGAVQRVPKDGVDPERWSAVAAAFDGLDAAVALARHLRPEAATEVADRLAKPRRLLLSAQAVERDPATAEAAVAGLSPEQAFEAGRDHQRRWEASRQARKAFLAAWAKAHRKLAGPKSPLTRADP